MARGTIVTIADKRKNKCDVLLIAMLGTTELVDQWWKSPNKAFNNNTPEVAYYVEPKEVLSYLMRMSEGEL